jgi:hypothetical protein
VRSTSKLSASDTNRCNDRAVWAAYGWPDDETPAEVAEDVILARLLALNEQRAEQRVEQRAGERAG